MLSKPETIKHSCFICPDPVKSIINGPCFPYGSTTTIFEHFLYIKYWIKGFIYIISCHFYNNLLGKYSYPFCACRKQAQRDEIIYLRFPSCLMTEPKFKHLFNLKVYVHNHKTVGGLRRGYGHWLWDLIPSWGQKGRTMTKFPPYCTQEPQWSLKHHEMP